MRVSQREYHMAGPNRGTDLRADFGDILDTVGRDAESASEDETLGLEPAGREAAAASFDFLQALDTIAERQTPGPEEEAVNAFAGLYADIAVETSADPEPPELPPADVAEPEAPTLRAEPARVALPESSDPQALATELGLRPGLKPAELRRIRRAFALDNHPDRLDEAHRELASRRMTLANSLIDEALRRTKAR
jgi:hypothetical protein